MSTPSQTAGPYLHIGLVWPDGADVVPAGTPGAVWIRGIVTDGAGELVRDGLVETWQADPDGRFDHPESGGTDFRGFGRCPTDADGGYAIRTLRPGALPGQTPHIDVSVFARGLLHRLVTRIYLPDDAAAHVADPVLASVPAARRGTLVATATDDGYRFDIRLQGPGETVFFDL